MGRVGEADTGRGSTIDLGFMLRGYQLLFTMNNGHGFLCEK